MTETKSTSYRYIHNRGSFFSEYFLGQLMQKEFKGKLGESTRKNIYRKLRNIYQRVSERLSTNSSPADTWNSWSFRLFEELGWPPSLERAEEILAEKDEVITNMHQFKTEGKPLVIFKLLKFDADLDDFEKGRRNTPHKVLERAVASTNSKWGIIFNGTILRLVRSESYSLGDSYLEIDLEGIFESDSEEEFYLFYALFRKESFIEINNESLLIKISEQSKNYAIKVNESLRDSVFQALETLLKGIVADHHNKHLDFKNDLHPLYEEGLVFLYRLLFILYGESRDLLPRGERVYRENYSVERLRDEVDDQMLQFHPNRYYLWESLSALFRLISIGVNSPDLYVTAYNGRLFNDKRLKYLPNCKVNDEVMKKVLILLSRTEGNKHHGTERIAYNELGVDQLGSVYEGLLEYEPKIAEEDLVVEYVEKEFRTVPKKNADKENIIEEIPKGSFYLSLWGGRRKGSGSYYTPSTLTKFLVKQAIDPLIEGKKSNELLSIKIVDPAMGSGAFLVAAAQYLSEKYTEKYVGEGNIDLKDINPDEVKKIINEHGRLIAEHCIYGVDLNPMAVELAKVSLWLATLSEGKPLSFLDHRLRCGNSLIGASLDNLEMIPDAALPKELQKENKEYHKILESYKKGQLTIEESIEYHQHLIVPLRHRLDFQKPEDTVEDVKKKEELLENDWREGSALSKLKKVCDLWCSIWFWPEDSDLKAPNSKIFRELKKYILDEKSDIAHEKATEYMSISSGIVKNNRFFHWEIEFPELFLDEHGKIKADSGFNVILGNPPWDKIKFDDVEYYSNYLYHLKSIRKANLRKKEIEKFLESNPIIKKESDKLHKNIISMQSFFKYSENYEYAIKGELNLYPLFLEKVLNLMNRSGRVGIIIKSGFLSDKSLSEFFNYLLDNRKIHSAYDFINTKKLFPAVETVERFLLLNLAYDTKKDSFSISFLNQSIEDLLIDHSIVMCREDILLLNPITKTCPVCTSIEEFTLLKNIYSKYKILSYLIKEAKWNISINSMYHMTNDSHLFHDFEHLEDKGYKLCEYAIFRKGNEEYIPLFEGKMVSRWDLFSKTFEGIPRKDRFKMRSEGNKVSIAEKQKTNYLNLPRYWIKKETVEKWYDDHNIDGNVFIFKSIMNVLNTYVGVGTISPHLAFGNSISLIAFKSKNINFDSLFFNAIFNSTLMDFVLKNKMSNANLNTFIIEQLPFPEPDYNSKLQNQIIQIVDVYYSHFDIFKSQPKVKPLNDEEYEQMLIRVDALIFILFSITKTEIESIFEANAPLKRQQEKKHLSYRYKEEVLKEYDNFKKKFGFSEARGYKNATIHIEQEFVKGI